MAGKCYSREELMRRTGASEGLVRQLQEQGVLVPYRSRGLFGGRQEYYTEGQIDVVRFFLASRLAAERARQPPVPPRIIVDNDLDS